MSTANQIKTLLLEELKKKVYRKALRVISRSKPPEDKQFDLISLRYMSLMLLPKEYESLQKQWKFATLAKLPMSLEESLYDLEESFERTWN